MANDLDGVMHRLMQMERLVSNIVKVGTVNDVRDDGQFRVDWGNTRTMDDQSQDQGSQGGQGGDQGGGGDDSQGGSEKPMLSPWIRSGHHSGWMTENVPFKKGQTVISVGYDQDHRVGLVMPFSYSDDNPKDGKQNNKKHTYRIRKPDDNAQKQNQDQQQGGGGQQAGGGQQQKPKKGKDDDDDVQYTRDYNVREIKIGKKLRIIYQREHQEEQQQQGQQAGEGGGGNGGGGQQKPLQYRIELGGDNSQNNGQDQQGSIEDNGPTVIEVKQNSIHITTKAKTFDLDTFNVNFKTATLKGDTLTIDAKTTHKKDVIHNEKTFLGGEDANKPVSMKGTVDSGGYEDLAPVSQTAFTK